MTTTNTGQGMAVADAEAQLLEMHPRQTRVDRLVNFAKSKPLGAVSAVIILLTIVVAAVSYAVLAVLPHDPFDVRAHEEKYLPPPARGVAGQRPLGARRIEPAHRRIADFHLRGPAQRGHRRNARGTHWDFQRVHRRNN